MPADEVVTTGLNRQRLAAYEREIATLRARVAVLEQLGQQAANEWRAAG